MIRHYTRSSSSLVCDSSRTIRPNAGTNVRANTNPPPHPSSASDKEEFKLLHANALTHNCPNNMRSEKKKVLPSPSHPITVSFSYISTKTVQRRPKIHLKSKRFTLDRPGTAPPPSLPSHAFIHLFIHLGVYPLTLLTTDHGPHTT